MRSIVIVHFRRGGVVAFVGSLMLAAMLACASGNMDATDKFAWSEHAGWVNFAPAQAGVTVHPGGFLSGFAWAENIGWIKLGSGTGPYANTDAGNWGVNLAPGGQLAGFAWCENAGWINFDPAHNQVSINRQDGRFEGYAWSEGVGWIHFRSPLAPGHPDAYGVRTTANLQLGTMLLVR